MLRSVIVLAGTMTLLLAGCGSTRLAALTPVAPAPVAAASFNSDSKALAADLQALGYVTLESLKFAPVLAVVQGRPENFTAIVDGQAAGDALEGRYELTGVYAPLTKQVTILQRQSLAAQ